jgi:hypothetical protein
MEVNFIQSFLLDLGVKLILPSFKTGEFERFAKYRQIMEFTRIPQRKKFKKICKNLSPASSL